MNRRGETGVYLRGKVWWISYHANGHRHREPVGSNYDEAVRVRAARLSVKHNPERASLTFAEIWDGLKTAGAALLVGVLLLLWTASVMAFPIDKECARRPAPTNIVCEGVR